METGSLFSRQEHWTTDYARVDALTMRCSERRHRITVAIAAPGSATESASLAKVSGVHKPGSNLLATNLEHRHEDCSYRRQRSHRKKTCEQA